VITVAFFNNKGGVGKTSLVYHLGWSLADSGVRVLLVDLDPQSNLTAMCLDEDRLESLWVDDESKRPTAYGAIRPIKEELGDLEPQPIEEVGNRLGLVVGDIRLASFEAKLSDSWPKCLDRHPPSLRATTALHRLVQKSGMTFEAAIALIDVGPNLGAINRSVLLAAEWVVTPIGADLFSIQGLRNLGPTLADWRSEWAGRRQVNLTVPELPLAEMRAAGYVVMQPNLYGGKVTRAYEKWLGRVPREYASTMTQISPVPLSVEVDPFGLDVVKHYRSLMPMAQEARKPIFHLTAADGALGGHATAAREAGRDFAKLAAKLAQRVGLALPPGA
jgi:cellulose biosynthesis protein BcsQ